MVLVSLLVANASAQQTRQRNRETTSAENRLTKEEVLTVEQHLSELGYWIGAVDGVLDSASRQAVIAFQKFERRKPTGNLTRDELALLLSAKPPLPREGDHAHVEVDLTRQILFFVDDSGKVSHILPVSSGSGENFTSEGWTRRAITSTGRFKVNNKIKGWRQSPLGLLYYPNYIYGGVAIHGNPSVPTRPASHGCIRIPMFAAEEFSRLTPIGTEVLVYETDTKDETP
jgi:peptidoglycan hydrolase-like protein with peptidoglycan-binding domain